MGRIYKRKNVWYIDVHTRGRRIRKRVGRSKRVAELALQDAEVKIARDEFGFAKNDTAVDRFLEMFLEYSRANHQPSTTTRYGAVIDHLREFLQTRPNVTFLSEITPETIDQYKVFRKNAWVNPNGEPVGSDEDVKEHTRKGARAHTINFEVGVLRTIFNIAIKWKYLKENPARGIQKLKVKDAKPVRFLTKDECRKLLDNTPPDLYPIYFTFLHTGMRKAELENLEWDDVDLTRRKIKIRRKDFWQPKTGEREIPMNDRLHELFRELKRANDRSPKSNFVFCHKDGGKLRVKVREKLVVIARRAGIKDLTRVHTLRHTFASHLVMSGVDLPTVKKLMGHSDIETTMIYAHLAPDHLSDAVNKLSYE